MHLSIGYQGGHDDEDFFEVSDDATPKEIEAEAGRFAEEWASNFIDLGYAYEPILTAPGNGNLGTDGKNDIRRSN